MEKYKLICSNCMELWELVGREYIRENGKTDYFCTNCKSKRKWQTEPEVGISEEDPDKLSLKQEETKDTLHITANSYSLRTLEDLERHSEIDTSVWEIDRCITNSWEVTSKIKVGNAEEPQTFTNYQIKAWWKRKSPKESALESFIQNIEPCVVPLPGTTNDNGLLHEICIFDTHFGKYAWKPETGENYDLKIAKNRFCEAVTSLSGKVVKPERILFPVGNDILNINTDKNTTYSGTQQDVDSRLIKIFEAAFEAISDSIFTLSKYAPVDVVFVPSNHDKESGYYLCFALYQKFQGYDNITVDISPKLRKAYEWGDSVIFLDHGELKPEKLVNILSTEFDKEWGGKTTREVHAGHLHKKQEISFQSVDEINGLVYRRIPSISSTDAWHYKMGFIGAKKAAQSFVFDKHDGLVMYFNHNIKDVKEV